MNNDRKVVDIKQATLEQKQQKLANKAKMAAWLTAAGIGMGAVGISVGGKKEEYVKEYLAGPENESELYHQEYVDRYNNVIEPQKMVMEYYSRTGDTREVPLELADAYNILGKEAFAIARNSGLEIYNSNVKNSTRGGK